MPRSTWPAAPPQPAPPRSWTHPVAECAVTRAARDDAPKPWWNRSASGCQRTRSSRLGSLGAPSAQLHGMHGSQSAAVWGLSSGALRCRPTAVSPSTPCGWAGRCCSGANQQGGPVGPVGMRQPTPLVLAYHLRPCCPTDVLPRCTGIGCHESAGRPHLPRTESPSAVVPWRDEACAKHGHAPLSLVQPSAA